jgi:hypothetical protein
MIIVTAGVAAMPTVSGHAVFSTGVGNAIFLIAI